MKIKQISAITGKPYTDAQQSVIDWAQWEAAYQVLWRRIERVSNTGYGSISEQLKEISSIGAEASNLQARLSKLQWDRLTQQPKNRRD